MMGQLMLALVCQAKSLQISVPPVIQLLMLYSNQMGKLLLWELHPYSLPFKILQSLDTAETILLAFAYTLITLTGIHYRSSGSFHNLIGLRTTEISTAAVKKRKRLQIQHLMDASCAVLKLA